MNVDFPEKDGPTNIIGLCENFKQEIAISNFYQNWVVSKIPFGIGEIDYSELKSDCFNM